MISTCITQVTKRIFCLKGLVWLEEGQYSSYEVCFLKIHLKERTITFNSQYFCGDMYLEFQMRSEIDLLK